MGAGTGFLSLLLAAQGYQVTAADFAPGMLARLKAKATDRGLDVQAVETDAMHPPAGGFDAVVERHLMWTLPDPAGAWPHGTLSRRPAAWSSSKAAGAGGAHRPPSSCGGAPANSPT